MRTIAAALSAAAALCASAAAQQPDRAVLPLTADTLQEIAYEFRFAYQPAALGTDALQDRLRVEAGAYCDEATGEVGLSDYAGLCTRIVMDAAGERLDEVAAGRRFAAN